MDMFKEMNRQLRKLVIAIGITAIAVSLIAEPEKKEEKTDESETHEFDDIW